MTLSLSSRLFVFFCYALTRQLMWQMMIFSFHVSLFVSNVNWFFFKWVKTVKYEHLSIIEIKWGDFSSISFFFLPLPPVLWVPPPRFPPNMPLIAQANTDMRVWSRANHTFLPGGDRRDHLICLRSIQVPVSSFPRHHQRIFITAWKNFPLWATVFRHSSRGRGSEALKAAGGDSISTWLKHFHVFLYLNEEAHIRGMLGRWGGKKNQEAIWKMIRLNSWLKLIWLRNSGKRLGGGFLGGVSSKCLSEFQGFACTPTITNGLECVSAPFMLRAGVFSPCPFQRHRVGDGLSPVASLTKVHEPRVALFNFCFLHNKRAMLTALSFMEPATPSRTMPLLPLLPVLSCHRHYWQFLLGL